MPPSTQFDLGKRVRALRLAQTLTLQEFARKSDVSVSALSKIENNQLSPTYDTLQKLAHGLSIDVAALFASEDSPSPGGRRSVTRAGETLTYVAENYEYQPLCSDMSLKTILPLLTTIRRNETGRPTSLLRHGGEEFIYVLEGEVEVETEFYQPLRLQQGDCIYFDSTMGHRCAAVGAGDARVLWIHASNGSDKLVQELYQSPERRPRKLRARKESVRENFS